MVCGLLATAAFMGGCSGDDGAQGPQGDPGPKGDTGDTGPAGPGTTALDKVNLESCATCHDQAGEQHQAIYAKYVDASKLALIFTAGDVSSALQGDGTYTVTLDFTITFNGAPYVDAAGLPGLGEKRFYAAQYVNGGYPNAACRLRETAGNGSTGVVPLGGGSYTVTQSGCAFAPETTDAQVYGYLAKGTLIEHEGTAGGELPEGSHVHLYDDVANTAVAFGAAAAGAAGAYVSAANVGEKDAQGNIVTPGCVSCHGQPYLKHGFRAAKVDGLPDFAACKSCHYDNFARTGSGKGGIFQRVDDPVGWANLTDPVRSYAYTANLMTVAHAYHAMEFPYPTSMANCVTCHQGKLDRVLANTNFKGTVCKTCHAVEGIGSQPGQTYNEAERAPSLYWIWDQAGTGLGFHKTAIVDDVDGCQTCHGAGIAPAFNAYHTGYNEKIYTAAGERYSDLYFVTIDNISLDGDKLTVDFSSNNTAICPELLVSLYGWDTKHFLIPAHDRDANSQRLEYVPESSASQSCSAPARALFTEAAGSVPGAWSVTVDLAAYQARYTESIPAMIASGKVKRAEVTITPELRVGTVDVAVNATGKTIDLNTGGEVPNYFKDDAAVVETKKCDVCHDSLATTFHDGSGRGGGGIQVCKNCHNPTFAGGHLETQSRSIESYVHAIHSFQDFDVNWTFADGQSTRDPILGFDPVFVKRYDQHIKHVFPNFTIRNCEACHKTGTASYNVPDQYESLYGLLSGAPKLDFWYDFDANGVPVETAGRKVGTYPRYVTGPAARTCGACHRARFINQDEAGELASMFEHHRVNGTVVEAPPDTNETQFVYDAITKIQEALQ